MARQAPFSAALRALSRGLSRHLMRIGLITTGVIDVNNVGRRAVTELLHRGHEIGMVPDIGTIDFIG